MPALLNVTDLWIAPVLAVAERFELTGLTETLVEAGASQ